MKADGDRPAADARAESARPEAEADADARARAAAYLDLWERNISYLAVYGAATPASRGDG